MALETIRWKGSLMILLPPTWLQLRVATCWLRSHLSYRKESPPSGHKLGAQECARYVGGGACGGRDSPEGRNTVRHRKWLEFKAWKASWRSPVLTTAFRERGKINGKDDGMQLRVTSGPGQTLGGGPLGSGLGSWVVAPPALHESHAPLEGGPARTRPPRRSRACFRKVLILERTKPDEGRGPSSACGRVTYIRLGKRGKRALTFCAGAAWGPRAALCLGCTSRVSGPCIGAFCCCTGFCPQTSKTLATSTWRTNLGGTRPLVLKRPSDSCRNGRQVTLVFIAPDLWGPSEVSRFVVRRDRLTWLVSRAPRQARTERQPVPFEVNSAEPFKQYLPKLHPKPVSLSHGSSPQHIPYTSASNSVDFCLSLEGWGWRLQSYLSHRQVFLKSFPFGSLLPPPVPCT